MAIQTNTPSAFSLSATSMNYLTSSQLISSYTKAKAEVDPNIVYRFGNEDLGIEEIFMNLGQTSKKGVESIRFEHYEKDYIRELVRIDAGFTPGSATALLTIKQTLDNNAYPYGVPNFYAAPIVANEYGANINVGDILQWESTKVRVTAITDVNRETNPVTFTVATLDGSTINQTETTLVNLGNSFAEGTGQPDGRETRLIKYSNDIQIIKNSYKVTGSAMGQKSWVKVQGGYRWYLEGIADTRKMHSGNIELSALVGEKVTATSSSFNELGQMEGMIPSINAYGVVEGYTSGSLSLDDFANVADAFAKNRGSKENMLFSGIGFKREVSDLLRTSEGLKAGGVQYAGLGGEQRAVNLGFESFTYSDYTFHTKTLQAFNDPKTLAETIYANYAVIVPTGNTTAFDYGKTKVNVPAMQMVYQEVDGEENGYAEWVTGAAGGVYTNENDSMKINMRTRASIEMSGLGRFAIMTA
jgi:hypothetical protein